LPNIADGATLPTPRTIALPLLPHPIEAIKTAANARDVPYQSLIEVWLQERIEQDRRR
jgi:predicted DNA binding CopG/RHH family protein